MKIGEIITKQNKVHILTEGLGKRSDAPNQNSSFLCLRSISLIHTYIHMDSASTRQGQDNSSCMLQLAPQLKLSMRQFVKNSILPSHNCLLEEQSLSSTRKGASFCGYITAACLIYNITFLTICAIV